MRRTLLTLMCLGALSLGVVWAQPAPQTARQALLEMFFSKTPGTLEKHLPEATRAALAKASAGRGTSPLNYYALLAAQFQSPGKDFQTYEAGPTLVSLEDLQAHTRFEITIERDDLVGEADEIELGFRGYKDRQPQGSGVTPHLLLSMKQEQGIWRINQATFSLQISLTDPELLKIISTPTPTPAATTLSLGTGTGVTSTATMSAANEASAISAIRTIETAEITYAASYPNQGFTCSLADLGGMGSGLIRDEHHAMLVDPRLASGRRNGYIFRLSGCNGAPASKFAVTAVPAGPGDGVRAFCSR